MGAGADLPPSEGRGCEGSLLRRRAGAGQAAPRGRKRGFLLRERRPDRADHGLATAVTGQLAVQPIRQLLRHRLESLFAENLAPKRP